MLATGSGKDAVSKERNEEEDPLAGDSDQEVTKPQKSESTSSPSKLPLQAHTKPPHPDPFSCRYCEKKFSQAGNRGVHEETVHLAVKPFKCSTAGCPRAYTRKQHLIEHEFTHTGETPYHCLSCPKQFRTQRYLATHQRKKHGAPVVASPSLPTPPSAPHASPSPPAPPPSARVDQQQPKLKRACIQCEQSFAHKKQLRAHVQAAHSNQEQAANPQAAIVQAKKEAEVGMDDGDDGNDEDNKEREKSNPMTTDTHQSESKSAESDSEYTDSEVVPPTQLYAVMRHTNKRQRVEYFTTRKEAMDFVNRKLNKQLSRRTSNPTPETRKRKAIALSYIQLRVAGEE